jgi:hypothetical protein
MDRHPAWRAIALHHRHRPGAGPRLRPPL